MKIDDQGVVEDLKKVPCSGGKRKCSNPVILITRWGTHETPSEHAYVSFCQDHLKDAERYIRLRRKGKVIES